MSHRRIPFRKGESYHLFNRGNNSQRIFYVEAQYLGFLDCLGRNLSSDFVLLHALSLLPNHYHISIQMKDDFDLSSAMQRALSEYATTFNKHLGRHGHVFEGRFKSVWLDTVQYQDYLTRYIHRNPVEAGLVTDPATWPFSSYRTYLRGELFVVPDLQSGRLPSRSGGWIIPQVHPGATLQRFESREAYKRFVLCDWERDSWELENGIWRERPGNGRR
jgi:REP element-mobilizing transposase RayT